MEFLFIIIILFLFYWLLKDKETNNKSFTIKNNSTSNKDKKDEWVEIYPKNTIPVGYKTYKRSISLKGTPNYMNAFMQIFKKEGKLSIVPEKDNKYDKNAIYIAFDDKKIGYIPKEIAKEMAKDIKPNTSDIFSIKLYKIGYKKDKKAGFMRFDLLIKK